MRNSPPPFRQLMQIKRLLILPLLCFLFPLCTFAQDVCNQWKIEVSAAPEGPAMNILNQLGTGPSNCREGGACDNLYYYVSLVHVGTENDATPYTLEFTSLNFSGKLNVTANPLASTNKTFSYLDASASLACSPAGVNDPNNSDSPTASWDTGGFFSYMFQPASGSITWTVYGRRLLFVVAVHAFPGEAIVPASLQSDITFVTSPANTTCGTSPVTSGTMEKSISSINPCGLGSLILSLGPKEAVVIPGYPDAVRVPVFAQSGTALNITSLEFLLKISSTNNPNAQISITPGLLPKTSYSLFLNGISLKEQRVFCSGKNFSIPAGNVNTALFYIVVNGPQLFSDCDKVTISFVGMRRMQTASSCCEPALGTASRELYFGGLPCTPTYRSTNAELKLKKSNQPAASCHDLFFALSLANTGTSSSISYQSGECILYLKHNGALSYVNFIPVDVNFNLANTTVIASTVGTNILKLVFNFTAATNIVVNYGAEKILASFQLYGTDVCVESIVFFDASLLETGATKSCTSSKVSTEINVVNQICSQTFSVLFEKQYSPPTTPPTLPPPTGIEGVNYIVKAELSTFEVKGTSNNGGFGATGCLCQENKQAITPFKDDNPLNGVSTYDLVLISRHTLGLEPLANPYKIIAADANKSTSVTTFDIVELRKLILGIYQKLPNNTSWRFVPEGYTFPNLNNPFQTVFPEVADLELQLGPPGEVKIYGIKVGDVNGNVIPSSVVGTTTEDREAFTLPIAYNLPMGRKGEVLEIPIFLQQSTDLTAWQLALRFDPSEFSVKDVRWAVRSEPSEYEMADWAIPSPGELRLSWFDRRGETIQLSSQSPIAYLRVERLSNRSLDFKTAFQLSAGIPNEIYDGKGRPIACTLQADEHFDAPAIPAKIIRVRPEWTVQAYPNPTNGQFRFEVSLPAGGAGQIDLFDPMGRLVARQDCIFTTGLNVVTSQQFPSLEPGIYFVRFSTPLGRQTLRLVKN